MSLPVDNLLAVEVEVIHRQPGPAGGVAGEFRVDAAAGAGVVVRVHTPRR